MKDKNFHINYWIDTAEESWMSAETLINGNRYAMGLFCWHLTIEKLLKAHWVKDNVENYPPLIHNLISLHDQTKLNFSEDLQKYFKIINYWNLEGRYPNHLDNVKKIANKNY